MNEEFVRDNWEEALESVENGSDLSSIIGYGFCNKDLIELCKLHEDNIHREKIEELLTDCNFHYECGLMKNGKYAEVIDSLDRPMSNN